MIKDTEFPFHVIIPIADDWAKAVKEIMPYEFYLFEQKAKEIADKRHKDAMRHYINNEI